jgi:hypothetical protein
MHSFGRAIAVFVSVLVVLGSLVVAEPARAATVTISGQVSLGSPGAWPAAGEVKVILDGTMLTSALTGPDGRFSISGVREGWYSLKYEYLGSGSYVDVWWPGTPFQTSENSFQVGTTDLVLDATLPVGGAVAGDLTDSAGQPINGVQVTAYLAETGPLPDSYATAQTVAGRYEIDDLPAGTYKIWFSAPMDGTGYMMGFYGRAPLTPSEETVITVIPGSSYEADFVAYRNSSVSGEIVCDCPRLSTLGFFSVVLERDSSDGPTPEWVEVGQTAVFTPPARTWMSYSFSGLYPGRYRVTTSTPSDLPIPRTYSSIITIGEAEAVADVDVRLPYRIPPTDFSGSGRPDIIARNPAGALLKYGTNFGGQYFGPFQIGSGWNGFDLVLAPGDLSGDGFPDLVARRPTGELYLYRTNGAGGFLRGSTVIGTGWQGFTTVLGPGDFSGDGKPDLIARRANGELYLYRGNGAGGFARGATRIGTGWQGFTAILTPGDFSGDGKPDLIARGATGDLYLYRGNGAGGFYSGSSKIGTGWQGFDALFALRDFSGDGKPDLLARTPSGDLRLYRGNGNGGFLRGYSLVTSASWGVPNSWKGLTFVP